MQFSFDHRGYLFPYDKIGSDLKEFKSVFVDHFGEKSSRVWLFQRLERYIESFQKHISEDFKLWINGSFVTQKSDPKDIDLIILLDYETALKFEKEIRNRFIGAEVRRDSGIDAYILVVYPKNHKLHSWTLSDLKYWENWFSRTRMNRRRIRFNKGFIEITFNEN